MLNDYSPHFLNNWRNLLIIYMYVLPLSLNKDLEKAWWKAKY